MSERVATRPIFEVCLQKEIGYTGRVRPQALWWRELAADTHLRDRLKEILAAAKDWRRQESSTQGKSEGRQDSGRNG